MQLIVFILFMVGIHSFGLTKNEVKASEWDIYDYEAQVAYASTETITPESTTKCDCKGTKQIKTGDGRTFPCPCDNCTCPKDSGAAPGATEVKDEPQAYLITASWCGPCHAFIANEVPKLKKMGYSVGRQGNIIIVDYDHDPKYSTWTRVVPSFVVVYKGKVIRSVVARTAEEVDRCYEAK